MNSAEPIIHIRGLRKVYQSGKVAVEALRGVDLDVPRGEFLSIVGPSCLEPGDVLLSHAETAN